MPSDAIQLRERVTALLEDAARIYTGTSWAPRLTAAAHDVEGPLRVALAGRVKAGKSTLLNALVGEAIAATDAGECTRLVTEYSYGDRNEARGIPQDNDGGAAPLPVVRDGSGLRIDLGETTADTFARLLVTVHNPSLRGLALIDTPGMASLTAASGAAAQRFLTGADEVHDGTVREPDAVIYLMRQLHVTDANFFVAFRDPAARTVLPVNAVGVLSRADEIGGGRDDALEIAARISRDYAQEPRLRPFVQTVVPVAGLLAEAAVTLTEDEHADLAALARLPAAATGALLVSADRFTAPSRNVAVDPARRARLLTRLGLFGIRFVLPLLRRGEVPGREELCSCLAQRSGVGELRAILRSQILGRRDVLKADAAFRLIQRATSHTNRPGARQIAARVERLRVGVHDFQELRLLNDLRLGLLQVEDGLRRQMEILLGAAGGDVHTRLGLPAAADREETERKLLAEHARWQTWNADVMTPPDLARAAAVLQRTLEGLRRNLAASPP